MSKITRADLRGSRLIKDICYKAQISHNECGAKDNRQFCYGLIDKQTDELIDECYNCKANVIYVGMNLVKEKVEVTHKPRVYGYKFNPEQLVLYDCECGNLEHGQKKCSEGHKVDWRGKRRTW